MNIRENLDVIVEHHPHYESLNRKLVEDSLKIEFKQRYDNIGAEMTGLRTSSPSIILIKKLKNIRGNIAASMYTLHVGSIFL